jgi:hypothetical protein
MKFDVSKIDKLDLYWMIDIIPETMMLCGILYQQYFYVIIGLVIAMFLSRAQARVAIKGKYTIRRGLSGALIMLAGTAVICAIVFYIFGVPALFVSLIK